MLSSDLCMRTRLILINKIPKEKDFRSANAFKGKNRNKKEEIRKKTMEIVFNINLLNFTLANICKNKNTFKNKK